MTKAHSYRITENQLDYLMNLNADQLIHIIADLTDRTVGIISALYEGGEIPQEVQDLWSVEEYYPSHRNNSHEERAQEETHILGGVIDMGAGVKEGCCSDECWCKPTRE